MELEIQWSSRAATVAVRNKTGFRFMETNGEILVLIGKNAVQRFTHLLHKLNICLSAATFLHPLGMTFNRPLLNHFRVAGTSSVRTFLR